MALDISKLKKKARDAASVLKERVSNTNISTDSVSKYLSESAEAAGKAINAGVSKSQEVMQTVIEHEATQKLVEGTKAGFDRSLAKLTAMTAPMDSSQREVGEQSTESDPEMHTQEAITKLKGRDKVGFSAEALTAVGGAAAGTAGAGIIAATAGATTLFGSTTLASVLGGIFVTTTPVGWIIGCAVIGGSAGYGLSRLIRSGGQQDEVRKQIIFRLNKRLQDLQAGSEQRRSLVELNQLMSVAVASEMISEAQANKTIELVEKKLLDPVLATTRIKSMLLSAGIIEEAPVRSA